MSDDFAQAEGLALHMEVLVHAMLGGEPAMVSPELLQAAARELRRQSAEIRRLRHLNPTRIIEHGE